MRRRSFSSRYPDDHPGPRYGPIFRAVRDMECWGAVSGHPPGHPECRFAVTAAHLYTHGPDTRGVIPACGIMHALIDGRAGRRAQEAFQAWLDEQSLTLHDVGQKYVATTRMVLP